MSESYSSDRGEITIGNEKWANDVVIASKFELKWGCLISFKKNY